MREKSKRAAGTTVTVDRAALQGLKTELVKERETSSGLRARLAAESELGRKAVEEAVVARKEREEYRRVLAAAIANEKQSLEAASRMRSTAVVLEDQLREAAHARGHAEGRAGELDRELGAVGTSHRESVVEAQQRDRARTAEHQRALQRSEYERGVAQGRVRELLPRIPGEVPAAARVAAIRARVTLAVAGFCLLLALMFTPDLLRVLFTPGGRTLLGVVAGMGAWAQLASVLGLSLLALGLAALGIRQLRAGQRAVQQAAEEGSKEGTKEGTKEGSKGGAAVSRSSADVSSTA